MIKLLQVVAGKDKGRLFFLPDDNGTLLLGKEGSVEERLNDVHISRKHCELRVRGNQVIVVDVDSSTGTFINRQRVTEQELHVGDILRLGETELVLEERELSEMATLGAEHLKHIAPPAPPASEPDDPMAACTVDFLPSAPTGAPAAEPTADYGPAAAETSSALERVPEQLGRYRIVKELGRGGMGAVYLAHDTQLDRPVALKVPHFDATTDRERLTRFFREARAAATLLHPNICPIYDVGEIDGTHYLTMAYIEGQPLSEVIGSDRPLPDRQAAKIVCQLAHAMEEAHQRGVIHRDLKPANILINARGEPVIMDFGLARQVNKDDVRLTRDGVFLGTPAYMAPEQLMAGGTATQASDIYSLGVILYRLLTAHTPFEGHSTAVLVSILTEAPPPPSKYRPDVPAQLDAACRKAMAREPSDRFASMAEFAAALDAYLNGPEEKPATPPQPASQTEELNVTVPGVLLRTPSPAASLGETVPGVLLRASGSTVPKSPSPLAETVTGVPLSFADRGGEEPGLTVTGVPLGVPTEVETKHVQETRRVHASAKTSVGTKKTPLAGPKHAASAARPQGWRPKHSRSRRRSVQTQRILLGVALLAVAALFAILVYKVGSRHNNAAHPSLPAKTAPSRPPDPAGKAR